MFKLNSAYLSDGYKVGHKAMLADGTTKLYGTWIPRSLQHAPEGITEIISAGQSMAWRWLHDEFEENFFKLPLEEALQFGIDISLYLGLKFDASHFAELHTLGYLPMRVKALPEGIKTKPGIPHMTFINAVDGYGWLTLYLETIVSSLSWKISTSATIANKYREHAKAWVMKTDPSQAFLIDYMCHDFSARGLDPFSMIASGLGHAMSHRGSDTLAVIPAARYFYGEPKDEVCINSVNASEHSVSTTKIFTVGEKQMIADWMVTFPTGILSIVADTFDLWTLITKYIAELKDDILKRDGKIVIRPDSGDPVDIICGLNTGTYGDFYPKGSSDSQIKGVVELLWDIFGGTINEQGYKVLDPHIGAIYGDSITLERQVEIYKRLAAKGFAATNIVLGIGSFTYQFNTRDTFGFAAKGAWFEANGKGYNIYKDPITDDGTKKSLKGMIRVDKVEGSHGSGYVVKEECTFEEESGGELQVIYEDGEFFNQTTLTEIRKKLM